MQQRVVRCGADQDEAARQSGAVDALRRWEVPTGRPGLRGYAGIVQGGP
ncbi:hypothetical protein [Streptomyces prasinus]